MSGSDEWMPIFHVMKSREVVHAAHPTEAKSKAYRPLDAPPRHITSRIGTAFLDADGSWILELAAIPLRGKIVLRRAGQDDLRDLPK